MSELTKRILFAVPAAAIFLWVTYMGGNAFQTVIFAIGLLTVWEIHGILQKAGTPDYFPVSLLFALFIWRSDMLPDWLVFAAVVLVVCLALISILGKESTFSKRWVSTLFAGIYAPMGYMMVIQIRELGINMEGFWLTLSLFLMIWGNDIFAYFGGKKFGRHPLAPKVSPNKTWEGFWFGFLGATIGFMITFLISNVFPLSIWTVVGAVLIVSVLGPIGDLLESKLKRIANVKDSSSLLPGHGGFFDRFDSLILTAPFIFLLYYILI